MKQGGRRGFVRLQLKYLDELIYRTWASREGGEGGINRVNTGRDMREMGELVQWEGGVRGD
jgi:hypothetical protein